MASKHHDLNDRTFRKIKLLKITVLIILSINIRTVESSENATKTEDISEKIKIIDTIAGRSFSDVYQNGTFRTGNSLWDNILNKCTVKPSISCLQKNVYSYLDESLDYSGDIEVSSGVCFKKNNVDMKKYSKEANVIYLTGNKDESESRSFDEENEINEEDESETPLEEVTDALYDRGIRFLMTHDMKLKMPEIFFHGATLKVSPRALTKTGALVHIDLDPAVDENPNGQGRIFFKKIKKFIRKKLVMAAIAIILVVKLIALKVIFVLPVIFGVTTVKKMFLKLLLFLFPALSHIFKLCSWYHNNYHTTKFHHHHHLITHHHKGPHGPHSAYGPPHPHGHGHSPSLVVKPHIVDNSPTLDNYPQDWELSGPGLGPEYIAADIHRNAIANFKPNPNDGNDINAWGLGLPPGTSGNIGEYSSSNMVQNAVSSPNRIPHHGRPIGPPNPFQRNKKLPPKDPAISDKEALIRAAALAARAPPSPYRDEIIRVSAAKLSETNRLETENKLVKQQQQILAASDPETIAAEKFYGGLLEKVDTILSPLVTPDPDCKERAVCSLYRDPFKHTPYSNLVSNELSKDSSELLPAGDSKLAIQYYRYVQAARDGQEQRDCANVYPNCSIDYESRKKK